jgi:ribonuclease HI
MKLWFDGGCRPNPGVLETSVVTGGKAHIRKDCGTGDNNDAEWLALIHALELAQGLGAKDVALLGDAAMIVHQARGDWPCKTDRFRAYHARFAALSAGFDRVRVRHIKRAQNLAGIALERHHGRL